MPSGWIRYMFEQRFPTPFELVYAPDLDAGNLIGKFDVIILPDGAGIGGGGGGGGGGAAAEPAGAAAAPVNLPPEFQRLQGKIGLDDARRPRCRSCASLSRMAAPSWPSDRQPASANSSDCRLRIT